MYNSHNDGENKPVPHVFSELVENIQDDGAIEPKELLIFRPEGLQNLCQLYSDIKIDCG